MTEWQYYAACDGLPVDVFFPVSDKPEEAEEAKSFCALCPVTVECLEYALDGHGQAGVWGGTTDMERRVIREQRAAERKAVKAAAG